MKRFSQSKRSDFISFSSKHSSVKKQERSIVSYQERNAQLHASVENQELFCISIRLSVLLCQIYVSSRFIRKRFRPEMAHLLTSSV